MNKVRFITIIIFCLAIVSCATRYVGLVIKYEDTKVEPYLKKLVISYPEYFNTPYTLVVMLDSQACGLNLQESVWWKDWQKFMVENNLGFVFVTSKDDSLDVAIVAKLDSVQAPILILPGNHKFISDLWKPGQSIPFKILLDSNGVAITYWLSIIEKEESIKLLFKIDTLVN